MTLCNLQIHRLYISFLFFFFTLEFACFINCENPPNECAKMIRQINTPQWPAKISCHGNLPDSSARIIRRIYSPEKSAISTRCLLARDPPLPCSKSPGKTGPSTLPPPQLRNGEGGRGQGDGPAHPRILNRYFSFFSPFHEWLHILIWHDTYIFYTERIKMV